MEHFFDVLTYCTINLFGAAFFVLFSSIGLWFLFPKRNFFFVLAGVLFIRLAYAFWR